MSKVMLMHLRASTDALKTFQTTSRASFTVNKGLLSMEGAESEGQVGHFH